MVDMNGLPRPESNGGPVPGPQFARSITQSRIDNPLHQQPGESDKAFAGFISYCELGQGRSIKALISRFVKQGSSEDQPIPPTIEIGTAWTWCYRNHWVERARVYDHQELLARNAERDRVRRERQSVLEEQEWKRGQELNKMADDVLAQSGKFLTTRRQFVPGKRDAKGVPIEPDREIVTIGIKVEAALKAAELGAKLSHLAAGLPMETVRSELDVKNMSDAQLFSYIVGLAQNGAALEEEQVPIDPDTGEPAA